MAGWRIAEAVQGKIRGFARREEARNLRRHLRSRESEKAIRETGTLLYRLPESYPERLLHHSRRHERRGLRGERRIAKVRRASERGSRLSEARNLVSHQRFPVFRIHEYQFGGVVVLPTHYDRQIPGQFQQLFIGEFAQ